MIAKGSVMALMKDVVDDCGFLGLVLSMMIEVIETLYTCNSSDPPLFTLL